MTIPFSASSAPLRLYRQRTIALDKVRTSKNNAAKPMGLRCQIVQGLGGIKCADTIRFASSCASGSTSQIDARHQFSHEVQKAAQHIRIRRRSICCRLATHRMMGSSAVVHPR